ncbi:MAG: hypothetical protein V7678_09585, partial [Brevundimonas sp.]
AAASAAGVGSGGDSGAAFAAFGLAAARGRALLGAVLAVDRVAGFFGGVAMNGSVLDRRQAASPFLAAP